MPSLPGILPNHVVIDREQAIRLADHLSCETGFIFFGNLSARSTEGCWFTAYPTSEPDIASLNLPPTPGSVVSAGLLNFEFGYLKEGLTSKHKGHTGSFFAHYDWYATYSAESKQFYLCFHDEFCNSRLSEMLRLCNETKPQDSFALKSPFSPSTDKKDYLKNLESIAIQIDQGDYYQVNYTQRFEGKYQGSTWQAYKSLCGVTDAQYCAYLNTTKRSVMCFSPELFLLIQSGTVTTSPIKGTRSRGATPEQDDALKQELLVSRKDRAENLMIVDLLRNDLGKVCETGSVTVGKLFDIESYTNVHQMVSTIHGKLKADTSPLQALLSAFPGGSITGAPKIKAMEVIQTLEQFERGPYCGSFFYISPNGDLHSNIAIRTLHCEDDNIYCHGGGGIVADSIPEEEYEESVNKVKLFMDTLEALYLDK